MTSVVEICNLGLSNIRGGSINSLTEGSIQAQQCKLKYPILRDQALRDSPWQFAHKIKALALLSDELFNWCYVYQYPTDCLYINRVMLNIATYSSASGQSDAISRARDPELYSPNLDQQVQYKIYNIDDNKVIACNEADIRIDYRARVTDTNLFDSQFVLMLAQLVGSELAMPVVGGELGRKLRSDSLAMYTEYREAAITTDANEQYTPAPESDFVTVRR